MKAFFLDAGQTIGNIEDDAGNVRVIEAGGKEWDEFLKLSPQPVAVPVPDPVAEAAAARAAQPALSRVQFIWAVHVAGLMQPLADAMPKLDVLQQILVRESNEFRRVSEATAAVAAALALDEAALDAMWDTGLALRF